MSMLGGLANTLGLGGNAAQQAQGTGVIQGGAYQQITSPAAMAQQMLMQQH